MYGRARDLFVGISEDVMKSTKAIDAIFGAMHQRDALSVVSEVYPDLNDLLSTHCGNVESFQNYE